MRGKRLPQSTERRIPPLAWGLLAAGSAIRIEQFLLDRSLWVDEAALALNIASRTLRQLTHPLALGQAAPIGYLWVERLFVDLFGVSEQSLRAVALVTGIVLLPVMWRVARELLDQSQALLALLLIAFCPALIYYSNEVKPYGPDALIAAIVLGFALALVRRPSRAAAVRLGIAGLLAVWFSMPVVFMLAGVGAALVGWAALQRRELRTLMAAICLVWGTAFVVAYIFIYRANTQTPYMQAFWSGAYLKPGSGPESGWPALLIAQGTLEMWFSASSLAWTTAGAFGGLITAIALSAIAIAGFDHIRQTSGLTTAFLLVVPIAAAFGASFVGLYPMATRLWLFLTPNVVLLVAAGVHRAARILSSSRAASVAMLVIIAFTALGIPSTGQWAPATNRWPESRSVAREVLAKRRPDEAIYVFARAAPEWAFYSTHWASPNRVRVSRILAFISPGGPSFDNAPRRNRPVVSEGDTVSTLPSGDEILGLSEGKQVKYGLGFDQLRPDSGWATNEVRRIKSSGASASWIYVTHPIGGADHILVAALIAAGARFDSCIQGRDTWAARVTFPARLPRQQMLVTDGSHSLAVPDSSRASQSCPGGRGPNAA
ncbi:MAG TPA: glycosyltransferase family 39 protein [Gemmatimonadales bacterium]|nr:glycosyltransferase family 39 protein [Gemmatimonadales bacterium]